MRAQSAWTQDFLPSPFEMVILSLVASSFRRSVLWCIRREEWRIVGIMGKILSDPSLESCGCTVLCFTAVELKRVDTTNQSRVEMNVMIHQPWVATPERDERSVGEIERFERHTLGKSCSIPIPGSRSC